MILIQKIKTGKSIKIIILKDKKHINPIYYCFSDNMFVE